MFIYCFDINEKNKLLLQGFNYICECQLGNHVAYVFEFDKKFSISNYDKKKFILTNKMYF